MRSQLTNLLPYERQRTFRRDYFVRLGVIIVILFIILTIISAVLLLPTYVFLTQSASTEMARLASIESTASSSDETALSAQLTALSNSATALSALAGSHSISAVMSKVLAVSRPGITLSGFSYAPGVGQNPGTIAISGTAATRDSLRAYQLALQGSSFARSANLPVSAYAKDSDIAFTITVTLAP